MKKILGISAFYHDSAAALSIGGKIVAAAQEERFTRKKNTAEFPVNAIRYCLQHAGLSIDELDAVVFYDKPILKFERLLETYYAFAPGGIRSFLSAMPVWLDEKIFLKKHIRKGLLSVGAYDRKKLNLQFTEHHLSHAASAFFTSPFNKSTILTIDGVGEWCTASIGIGEGQDIRILREMSFPHSVGLLYSAFTYFLGFRVNSGEYKLMGLAPYGNEDEETRHYEELIRQYLVDIKSDGSIWLNQAYFTYSTGLKMLDERKWAKLFSIKRREPESDIGQAHCNLALAIQRVTEDIVLKMAAEARRLTGCENLCLAGGVALNCVANGKLLRSGLFAKLYIQPAAGDAGGAIGAALASSRMFFRETVLADPSHDQMQGAYLGPEYSPEHIQEMCTLTGASFTRHEDFNTLSDFASQALASGHIIGWFQGRMEFGPRALGNRSILAYAGEAGMQEKINSHIKFREGFRPFAPAVQHEDSGKYFDLEADSPYMLLVAPLRPAFRKDLPHNYSSLPLWDKLKVPRSEFQPITHVDFSARVQGVHAGTNPRFYQLIGKVKLLTGHGMLVNTSFNVRGEPVVCTPEDAFRCFMQTDMDHLVINDYLFSKTAQDISRISYPEKTREQPQLQASTARKSVFTIAIGFFVLYLVFHRDWQLVMSVVIAAAGFSSLFLARWIHIIWMRIAHILGLFMPRIILGAIFYFVLFPIAVCSRIFSRKDPLMLKNKLNSTFREEKKMFSRESFGKPW